MNWRHPSTNIWSAGDYEIRLFRHPFVRQKNKFKAYWSNTSIDKTGHATSLIEATRRCEAHLALRVKMLPASIEDEIPEHASVA